jgi:hypothetical protein
VAAVGCLGDIAFTVSSETVRTIDNMKWSGSARYSTHQRHISNALTEFTGLDPDKITFNINLMASLGVNPMDEVTKLWKYERDGEAVPLTIGDHAYGRYRWTIESHSTKVECFGPGGELMYIVVQVSLQEYLRS